MCKWNPVSEIPPFNVELLIVEEKENVAHFGYCHEDPDYDDSFDMEYEFHPDRYCWHVHISGKWCETTVPEYWLQLPKLERE